MGGGAVRARGLTKEQKPNANTAAGSCNFRGGELTYDEQVSQFAKGIDNATTQDVEASENKWQKIVDWCSGRR
jgi:hypothetical protein